MADEDAQAEKTAKAGERTAPSAEVVYEAILNEGEGELTRATFALFWSGLAAGLSMGLSLIAMGLLQTALPDEPWRPLVVNLGYTLGFLAVVLGRQQLFTENTLTAILPLLNHPTIDCLKRVARLWVIVFGANVIGAAAFALVVAHTAIVDENVRGAFDAIGQHSLERDMASQFAGAIVAGWLIALMVWMLPAAGDGKLAVVVILSYAVGLGSFGHIIAGSVEVLYLVAVGQLPLVDYLTRFAVPVLAGNIVGGVALVALVNHGQVRAGSE